MRRTHSFIRSASRSLLCIAALAFSGSGCDHRDGSSHAASTQQVEYRYQVDGMHCASCSAAITEELNTLPNVSDVSVSHETRLAVLRAPVSMNREVAAKKMRSLGFIVTELDATASPGPVVTAPK
ncbi:MAG: heavy metal-associated domain-containing protein [Planctomycetota bacterium]|nr:heavy metal-associated domain-containing protein [Planctomycetota bacterium]